MFIFSADDKDNGRFVEHISMTPALNDRILKVFRVFVLGQEKCCVLYLLRSGC